MDFTQRIFQNRTFLIVIAVLLLLVELQIFFIFAGKSGKQNTLQIMNDSGTVIYETDGKDLTQFKKYYFEETFGPFENYEKKLITQTVPFPFRAWFTAAIGIPLGFALLFSFIISAFSALSGRKSPAGDTQETSATGNNTKSESRVEQLLAQINRMNVFMVGTAVFLLVVAFWVLPNLVSFVGQTGLNIIDRYRWFFAVAAMAVLLLFAWVIYLRYRLASKTLEAETRFREHQLRLDGLPGPESTVLKLEDKSDPSVVDIPTPKD